MVFGPLTTDEMRQLIAREICMAGGQSRLAREAGVTQQEISYAVSGRRKPSCRLLRYLGFRVDVRYVRETEMKTAD
jgi:DNA-binding phage protein